MTADDRARLMEAGRLAFNAGDFYEAHEHWEEVWLELDDPDHRWVQGLIQVATGLHKLHAGHARPAATLFAKALVKLADAPSTLDGIDVARAVAHATERARALAAGELPPAGPVAL